MNQDGEHPQVIDDEEDVFEEEFVEEEEVVYLGEQHSHPQPAHAVQAQQQPHQQQPHQPHQHQQQQQLHQQQQLLSVVDNLPAFASLVLQLLGELPALSEYQLQPWLKSKLLPLCMLNSHNFLFVHSLLRRLAAEWHDGEHSGFAFNRIIEELDSLSRPTEESRILSEIVRFGDDLPTDVVTSLINIRNTKKPTTGDIMKLHRAYTSPTPPPVEYLRAPYFMEALISDCYLPSGSNSLREERLWLMAFSASAIVRGPDTPPDATPVKATYNKLKDFDAVVSRVTSMAQLQDRLDVFLKALDEPVVSAALLFWLEKKLKDPEFYEWIAFSMGDPPAAFHVLDEASIRHPEQRGHVFKIWCSLMERDFAKVTPLVVIQFRERFLDHFLMLLKVGFVVPVFQYLLSKADNIDDSLMLYFISKLLSQIEFPDNRELASLILSLINTVSPASLETQPAVMSFIEQLAQQPYLAEGDRAVLSRMMGAK
nr:Negative elongation factor C/D [Polyrhizophydium stewartii]